MDQDSWVFVAAFLGSAFGLPMGFLLIEFIKLARSRGDRANPAEEIMEWAITQPGIEIVDEQQVANNWIRTYDTIGISQRDDGDDDNTLLFADIPYRYCTTAVGGVGCPPPLMTNSLSEATENQASFVSETRLALRILPK